jgi:carboxymethylenebutenolidase
MTPSSTRVAAERSAPRERDWLQGMPTSAIDIPTPDGVADAFIARPDGPGPYPGVVLNMDGVGLRPVLEAMATRLAENGYVVLVPNAFYRGGRAPVIPLEELFAKERSPETMQKLMGLIGGMTPESAASDAAAWVAYLDAQDDVSSGPMGTLGYCMGAALAIRTAAAFPDRVTCVAGFHGGNLATDKDTSPHLLLQGLKVECYFGHADNDGSAPPEQQERLKAALEEAGLVHEAELIEGAGHGWTMSDLPVYDEDAAERAWQKLVALLARNL